MDIPVHSKQLDKTTQLTTSLETINFIQYTCFQIICKYKAKGSINTLIYVGDQIIIGKVKMNYKDSVTQ